jgi:DNA replication protein DnaC
MDELNPDEFSTIEVPCKVCALPVTVPIHHDADNRAIKSLLKITVHNECHDKLVNQAKSRAILDKQAAQAESFAVMCPKEFQKPITFNKTSAKVYDKIMAWDWKDGRGLYLHGRSGMCKTRFAWALVKREMMTFSKAVVAVTHTEFRYNVTLLSNAGAEPLASYMKRLQLCDILFIDDLGKGRITPAAEEALESLIDCRTRNNKPMLVTANNSLESIAKLFGPECAEPIVRRLTDYCESIKF